MKDALEETLKYESKILYHKLLRDYYKGNLTWLQYKQEESKVAGIVKALTEEADVKPSFRAELESHTYPIDWWLNRNTR